MKAVKVALITAGASALVCAGYFAVLTALLVRAHNKEAEDIEEVRQVI